MQIIPNAKSPEILFMEGVIFGLSGEVSGNFDQCLDDTRDD